MTYVRVRSLLGIGGVPSDRTSAGAWLSHNGIATVKIPVNGGKADAVHLLSDLPLEVRCAYELRRIAEAGLEGGEFDAEAHESFAAATAWR